MIAVDDTPVRCQLQEDHDPGDECRAVHHRLFASGWRACELDSGIASPIGDPDTDDVHAVTCEECIQELKAYRLLVRR